MQENKSDPKLRTWPCYFQTAELSAQVAPASKCGDHYPIPLADSWPLKEKAKLRALV